MGSNRTLCFLRSIWQVQAEFLELLVQLQALLGGIAHYLCQTLRLHGFYFKEILISQGVCVYEHVSLGAGVRCLLF